MEEGRHGAVLSRLRQGEGGWSAWRVRELCLRQEEGVLILKSSSTSSSETRLQVLAVERHHYAPPSLRQLQVSCAGASLLELRWPRATPSFIRDDFGEWEAALAAAADRRAAETRSLRTEWADVFRRHLESRGFALPPLIPGSSPLIPRLNVLVLVVGTRGEWRQAPSNHNHSSTINYR